MTHILSPWQHANGEDVNVHADFLMTVVGCSDHWLFASSTGALTAGRVNAANALFSYETEDRLHRAAGQVGPLTILRCASSSRVRSWFPFDPRGSRAHRVISKTTLGDALRFRERHPELGLTFSYTWRLSDEHGFIRSCELELDPGAEPLRVDLLDGLLAILPHRVDVGLQQSASVLVDAYKRAELVADGVAVYALNSRIVDSPDPAESLSCAVAYQWGLPEPSYSLSDSVVSQFLDPHVCEPHMDLSRELLGRRGHFLARSRVELAPGETLRWHIGADTAWEAHRVVELIDALSSEEFTAQVDAAIERNTRGLLDFVARSDGFERSALPTSNARHASNVMFNCMRGGVPVGRGVPIADFVDYLHVRSHRVASQFASQVQALGEHVPRERLLELARSTADRDFIRLCSEYMPLTFSRRHGDPSRPWNAFNIKVREPDGTQRLWFEGNWRDVFQNWEALVVSFPEFVDAAIVTFLDASTLDGHNPYRISRDGIDWERPDPEDPWANIGYWGDHQIIYQLKLLELYEDLEPGALTRRLDERAFVYADVPYRIKPFEQLVEDPHHTIEFDKALDRAIDRRVEDVGADGRLVHAPDGQLLYATLAEKLLVPVLAKLSNLVLDAGIWMNTQRPEWNDANNALVGYGVSVVTLAYLLRHVRFLERIFGAHDAAVRVHEPVARWLEASASALASLDLHSPARGRERATLLASLGQAASEYREVIYGEWEPETRQLATSKILALLTGASEALEASLARNKRDDGFYHAYNLIAPSGQEELPVSYLYLMLEGQVAALSAGALSARECIELVDALFDSPLYREDQNSFLLYPERQLPGFMDRHVIAPAVVESNPLMLALARDPDTRVVQVDARGIYRFGGELADARGLASELDELAETPRWSALIAAHRQDVLDAWEQVFHHFGYTGRSASMYGYEGLGSIYWHMVSKLDLAVAECFWRAHDEGADRAELAQLAQRYYRLRAGLGDYKTFAEYGAFPTDAYSHTPPRQGARQPGMTGQVKEDILTRRAELGVRVRAGCLSFEPALLRRQEFLDEPGWWAGISDDQVRQIELAAGQLAFTVCQLPVIYTLTSAPGVRVSLFGKDGDVQEFDAGALDVAASERVFTRDGALDRIEVSIPESSLNV